MPTAKKTPKNLEVSNFFRIFANRYNVSRQDHDCEA